MREFKAKVFSYKNCPHSKLPLRHARLQISNTMTGRLEEEKKKRAELRCQTTEVFLVLYYRANIYSCADVCVCQALTLNLWARVETAKCCVELSGWAVLMAAWGYWKAKGMCLWARNSCSPEVMTTCVLSAWFMDIHDLSSLLDLWQDRQDAVNILNTPNDICFHFGVRSCFQSPYKSLFFLWPIFFSMHCLLLPRKWNNNLKKLVTNKCLFWMLLVLSLSLAVANQD